jgi:hypothetical protein
MIMEIELDALDAKTFFFLLFLLSYCHDFRAQQHGNVCFRYLNNTPFISFFTRIAIVFAKLDGQLLLL